MRFLLLGSLEAWGADQQIRLGGPRERRLLAALAVDFDRLISVDRLVDILWGDEPPATATKQIHNSVARLRRTLAGGGIDRDLIVSDGPGYRLNTKAEDVDAGRFERLLTGARGIEPAAALRSYQEALSLWRGPALSGMDGRAIRAIAARLDERHIAACEEYAQLCLQLGRHQEVVADLLCWTAEHSLRERLIGQLMLALHRCGRSTEALEAYRQVHSRLVEEHGTEPGTELKDLHSRILRNEEKSAAPAHGIVAPAQLPPSNRHFVGRESELRVLDSAVSTDSAAIIVVSGTAGVGKTALALRWAQDANRAFADGRLYVDLRGFAADPPVRPLDAISRLLTSMGLPADRMPMDLDQASMLWRAQLAGKRMVVILDNALNAEQVRPLLPSDGPSVTIVTSRNTLTGLVAREGAAHLRLGMLTPAASLALLEQIVGVDRVAAELEAAADVTRLCAHLPLALRIAAANLAVHDHQSIAGYRTSLSAGDRLEALDIDEDTETAVSAAFRLSYESLSAPARSLFRRLGLAPGADAGLDAIAAIAALSGERLSRAIHELISAHLLEASTLDRFRLHDLLKIFAARTSETTDPASDRDATVHRLLSFYLAAADGAAEIINKNRMRFPDDPSWPDSPSPATYTDADAALRWLDSERPNLVAAIDYAADHPPHHFAWRLADALRGYFLLRAHPADWLAAGTGGLRAAEQDGHQAAQAALLAEIGQAYWRLGNPASAIDHFTRSVAAARRAGWLWAEAASRTDLASIERNSGHVDRAIEHLRVSTRIYRRIGWVKGEATSVANLALAYGHVGRLTQAVAHIHRVLPLFESNGQRTGVAIGLANLAELHIDLGRLGQALLDAQQALRIQQETGDLANAADTRRIVAAAHSSAGRQDEAYELVQAALNEVRETRNLRYEADALNCLGDIHHRRALFPEALVAHGSAAQAARAAGYPRAEAQALIGLATNRTRMGDPWPAAREARQALSISRETGLRVVEGKALTALAMALADHLDLDQAASVAHEALTIHEETGHRLGSALTRLLMSDIAEHSGDGHAAARHRAQALATLSSIGATWAGGGTNKPTKASTV